MTLMQVYGSMPLFWLVLFFLVVGAGGTIAALLWDLND
jgi:hypothetical protein